MKTTFCTFALTTCALLAIPCGALAAERADTYKIALERAKQTKASIAVFQRGSDWSHLGELLYNDVWNQPSFLKEVGGNVILVAIDNPEDVGAPPVSKHAPEDAQPIYEDSPSPSRRLRRFSEDRQAIPKNEITAIACDNGSTFSRGKDGACVAVGPANPAQEVLTLTLKPANNGRILRIDFLTNDTLRNDGPGRADNGNFVISEVEIQGVKATAAYASRQDGNLSAAKAVDGIADKSDNGWNSISHGTRQPVALLVSMDVAAKAGEPLTVRLIAKSQWAQHTPGCISAAVVDNNSILDDITRVFRAQREIEDNAGFGWRGVCTPRIALMDCEGRPVACENKPRENLTVAGMAALVQQMEKTCMTRDSLWQEAEKAAGARRAEYHLDGLLAMGETIAFEGCYDPIHDKIRADDADGNAGCSRRLMFPPDVRHVPPIVNDAYKLVDQKKFEEALAKIDAELKHPGNKRLTHENIQRIMIGKFHVYRRWPGHEDNRYDVQREIHKFDPDTFWGTGALGYLWTFKQNTEPVSLPHGWEPCHVKAGVNQWQFTYGVVPQFFDHVGDYTFRILHRGGKDALKIRQVTLLDGDKPVSNNSPNEELPPASSVEVRLKIPSWPPQGKLSVKLEVEAEAGKTDAAGRFEVEPLL